LLGKVTGLTGAGKLFLLADMSHQRVKAASAFALQVLGKLTERKL
jgi:hypothetical protein